LPNRHRCGDALDLDSAKIAVLEEIADQPASAAAMTTVSGSAKFCKRAARLGVSPTTDCSCAGPAPIKSPTTISPVAIPTRAWSLTDSA